MNNFNKTGAKVKVDLDSKRSFHPSPPRTSGGLRDSTNKQFPMIGNNMPNSFMFDIEKIREELIQTKSLLHKKNKEFSNLKINYLKIEDENKKNSKLIQEILEEAQRKGYEDDVFANMSPSKLQKLKEANLIINLKRQLFEKQNLLNIKEDEISSLKNNSKVTKFQELENKYYYTSSEFNVLNEKFSYLKSAYGDQEAKSLEAIEERDQYKTNMNKVKQQYEEIKTKLIEIQNINNKLLESKKAADDKNSMLKFQINSMKSQIRERENEIGNLKKELEDLESYKYEKEKYQKTISHTVKNNQSMKDEIDRKTRHIKEIEKVLLEMNCKMETIDQQKDKKDVNLINMKEKDKKIKYLEGENNKLRSDLEKERNRVNDLEYELSSLKDSTTDTNELDNLKKQIEVLRSNNAEWQEHYQEMDEKYKTLLQQYVDYQEDATYRIEKLEKKDSHMNTISKFNIKPASPEKKKNEKAEKLMVTELNANDEEEAYNEGFDENVI